MELRLSEEGRLNVDFAILHNHFTTMDHKLAQSQWNQEAKTEMRSLLARTRQLLDEEMDDRIVWTDMVKYSMILECKHNLRPGEWERISTNERRELTSRRFLWSDVLEVVSEMSDSSARPGSPASSGNASQ